MNLPYPSSLPKIKKLIMDRDSPKSMNIYSKMDGNNELLQLAEKNRHITRLQKREQMDGSTHLNGHYEGDRLCQRIRNSTFYPYSSKSSSLEGKTFHEKDWGYQGGKGCSVTLA
jgi:hypothetical protein